MECPNERPRVTYLLDNGPDLLATVAAIKQRLLPDIAVIGRDRMMVLKDSRSATLKFRILLTSLGGGF